MIKKSFFLLSFISSVLLASVQAAQPKLVVAILIDQLTYDYLDRFQEHFTTNGFRLFTERGTFMTFAHYNYVPTVTGPGHASFLSGSTPLMHGIIANDWLDRKTGNTVYCVEDSSVDGVGATPGSSRMSPRNFIGGTFADEFRLRFNGKVVGISMKDRGAILPAGKKPTGAYWFHTKNGNFVTSSYYRSQLPEWVQKFNERKRAASFVGQKWERLVDKSLYVHPDDGDGEGLLHEEKKPVFPHTIIKSKDGFDNIMPTPFGNQILAEFAEAVIEGEQLGQGSKPDLLSVSFSSVDYCGHRFGPYSHEIQDIVLRLDRQLNDFFNYLDAKIGLANVVMTLTADHAVAPLPEFAKSQGLDSHRWDEGAFLNDLKEQLAEEFGPGRYFLSSRLFGGNLYLNHATLQKKGLETAAVISVIREAALATGKIHACYSRDQILEGRVSGPFAELVINGYNAERGGDVVFLAKPYIVPGGGKTGTTHGSAYSYDTHIPIMFYGAPFQTGRFNDVFTIADIVPTLCAGLQMQEPAGNMGKPCLSILRK